MGADNSIHTNFNVELSLDKVVLLVLTSPQLLPVQPPMSCIAVEGTVSPGARAHNKREEEMRTDETNQKYVTEIPHSTQRGVGLWSGLRSWTVLRSLRRTSI